MVKHLHYHIIPSSVIGDLDHKGEDRKIMSEKEIADIMEDFKKASAV